MKQALNSVSSPLSLEGITVEFLHHEPHERGGELTREVPLGVLVQGREGSDQHRH